MSKGRCYIFNGTIGDIIELINSLPPKPNAEFLKEWTEVVIEAAQGRTTSREFYHKKTKLRIRFEDRYLDKDGNPVAKDSNPSHIIPRQR